MGRRGGFLVPFGRIANRLYIIPADVWIMHSNSLPKRTVKKGGEKSNLAVGTRDTLPQPGDQVSTNSDESCEQHAPLLLCDEMALPPPKP